MLVVTKNSCLWCGNDPTLLNLKNKISEAQKQLKRVWELTVDELYTSPDVTTNHVVAGTIIPSYKDYNDLWSRSFHPSPFVYDWAVFDIHDSFDRAYIIDVYDTIMEQLIIWSVDLESYSSDIYQLFQIFTDRISHLKNYTFMMGI